MDDPENVLPPLPLAPPPPTSPSLPPSFHGVSRLQRVAIRGQRHRSRVTAVELRDASSVFILLMFSLREKDA